MQRLPRVAHLALDQESRKYLFRMSTAQVFLTPDVLHPVAAASFANILRQKLHSLLCLVTFQSSTRGVGMSPIPKSRFHFAQTFPLRRRGNTTGAFHWFEVDPRPGVELDLRQLMLSDGPSTILQGWRQLEQAFGITKEQQAARENDHPSSGFRLYICPSQTWPTSLTRRMNESTPFNRRGEEDEAKVVWSRDELAQYLQQEAEDWVRERKFLSGPGCTGMIPKYSYDSPEEAEMFEMMEKLPCTAIGMWLFPAEVFPEPPVPHLPSFKVAIRPGLLLFQV